MPSEQDFATFRKSSVTKFVLPKDMEATLKDVEGAKFFKGGVDTIAYLFERVRGTAAATKFRTAMNTAAGVESPPGRMTLMEELAHNRNDVMDLRGELHDQ